jgi:hypothetical protein
MSSTDRPTNSEGISEEPCCDVMLDRVSMGLILLNDAVTELADADAVEVLATLVAQRVDLPPDEIVRAIDAPSEQALMAICRAAGLSLNGFSAILRMCRRRGGVTGTPAQALAAFQETHVDVARRVVTMLKLRDVVDHSG